MKAVIFDLDGVLVSTDLCHYEAWKQIADRLKIPFDRKINNRLRGVSRMDSLAIILENYHGNPLTQEDKIRLAEEKNNVYRKLLQKMTPGDVPQETRETLRELKKRGYRIAVGSSSKNTRFILNKTGLEEMFDAIADGTMITQSKPDPEVFLKAAALLREKPADCMVVEDAKSGIDAAAAAGMETAGIGEAAEYEKTKHPIHSLPELIMILEQ